MNKKKGVIGILTGGGDVPGLNPAIRAVTIRAIREGYQVIGIRRGWAGLIDIIREKDTDNSNNFQILSEEIVNRAARGGNRKIDIGGLGLAPEPGQDARCFGGATELGGKDGLDGDGALDDRVKGFIDGAHGALAKASADHIFTEFGHRRHAVSLTKHRPQTRL